jgi:glycosyltransferase involved in cell wall biosynthesis
MIGDDPPSFAAAIGELYSDGELWQRVADNGRRRIEQHFTPVAVAETINRSIKEL